MNLPPEDAVENHVNVLKKFFNLASFFAKAKVCF